MNPYISATAIGVSKAAAGLISIVLRRGSLSDLVKVLQSFGAVAPKVVKMNPVGSVPTSYWIFDPPFFSAAVFQGIEVANYGSYVSQLGSQEDIDNAGGFHPGIIGGFLDKGYTAVIDNFRSTELQLAVGHSLGGAAALTLAAAYPFRRPGQQRGVVTFGSPRPFAGVGPSLDHCTSVIRWIRNADGITKFPPRIEEQFEAWLVCSQQSNAPCAAWYQPFGGRVFDRSGGWSEQASSGLPAILGGIELGRWAAGLTSSLSHAHDFLGYAQSIEGVVDLGEGFWSRPLEKSAAESPSFTNPPIQFERAAAAAGFPLPMSMGCKNGPSASQSQHVSPVI